MRFKNRLRILFFLCSVAVLQLAFFPAPSRCETNAAVPAARKYRLSLYNLHTQQRINIVYRIGSKYLPAAVERLDYFLRDYRTNTVDALNPRLFDLLHDLDSAVGRPDQVIDIGCGYRTPWTNHYLREHTVGVAKHSLHMLGEAIDIRIPGVPTLALRNAALALHRGGVGYYPQSRFVHVDVGRVRTWTLGG